MHTHTTPLTMLSSSTGGLRSPLRPSTLSAASYLPTTAVRTPPCPRAGFIPPRLPGLSAPAHTDLPSPQTRNIKYFPALPFSIFRLATARCCGGRRATAAGSGPADQRNIFDMSPPPIHSSQHFRCLSAFLRRKEKSVSDSFCFRSFQVRPFSTLKLLVWRTPCIRRRFKAGGLKDLFPALLNSSPIKPAVPVSSRGRREEKKQENAHPKNGHLQSRCWQTVTFSVVNVWYPSVVNTPPCFQPLLHSCWGTVCTIS